MTGLGLTVTTTSTKLPEHPLAVGTIRYVTVPEVVPSVDVSTWLIVAPDPATAPDTFVDVSTVHVKVVPEIALGFVIATFVLVPEHIVSGEAAASGIGLTVTLTAYGVPTHAAADGRIIYVTVPTEMPSVDVKVCAMVLPEPAEAFETLFTLWTVHVNVVEGTPLSSVIGILVVCPLQIAASAAKASGIRLTVRVAFELISELQLPVTTTLYILPLKLLGTFDIVRFGVVAPLYTPPFEIFTPFTLH